MATVEVKDMKGAKVGTAKLSDTVFGVQPNTHAVHLVVRSQMAGARQGTHDTRTRGEVSGGGAKPFRQKGTGRARAGTTRAPQWTGGGAVFGPHPRNYGFRVPNKVVKLAMRSVLSAKAAEGVLFVVDGLDFSEPSTKAAAAMIAALGVQGRVTVVIPNGAENAEKSFRNIERVRVITAAQSNTYDLVDNAALVLSKPALEYLEGVLA
jgi:large subunit ribosomal protein L4